MDRTDCMVHMYYVLGKECLSWEQGLCNAVNLDPRIHYHSIGATPVQPGSYGFPRKRGTRMGTWMRLGKLQRGYIDKPAIDFTCHSDYNFVDAGASKEMASTEGPS